jgi:acetoin utilization protein AcuB
MRFIPSTVDASDSVAHARALIEEHRINLLPVLSGNRLVGIVTDRSLRKPAGSSCKRLDRIVRRNPDRVRVKSIMRADAPITTPADTLWTAAKLMRRERIKALPVVEDGQLRGVVSFRDIRAALLAVSARAKKTSHSAHVSL